MRNVLLMLAAVLFALPAYAQSTLYSNSTSVGIGTTSPQYLLDVSGNSTTPPGTAISGTVLHLMGANAVTSRVMIDAFGSTNGSVLTFRSTEGTAASPTATNSGDILGSITASGYGATGYSSSGRAKIELLADQNWTDTAQGTDIAFLTTADGTTTTAETMRITAGGNVGIGTTSPGNPLSVNGIIESQTGGFKFPDGTTQTTAASGSGSAGMVLLATVNASGASSVSFGSSYITSTYNKYVIEFDGLYWTKGSGQNPWPVIQVSTNNGSSWLTSNYSTYIRNNFGSGTAQQGINMWGGSSGTTNTNVSETSTTPATGTIKFSNPSSSTQCLFSFELNDPTSPTSGSFSNAGNSMLSGIGFNSTTTSINAIQLIDYFGRATITGKFHLYGLSGT